MKYFDITYTQGFDSIPETTAYRGHDAEHAESRFIDSFDAEGGNEGVRVLSVVAQRPVRKTQWLPESQAR